MEKAPLVFRSFFVDSHQRFHSASVKTSPTNHSLIWATVAWPPRLSIIFRTRATGSSLANFLIDARSFALRARKWLRREWRKVLRRVLNLHGMGLFPRKIDYDLIKEKVPFCHATEPPTLVQTKCARLQFFKLLSASCSEFSRFNQFFQFDVHFQECTNYDERSKWRGKSLLGRPMSRMRRSARDVRRLKFAVAVSLAA